MKTLPSFIAVLCALIFLFSCKKDSDHNPAATYYMKATVAGKQKSYTNNLVAGFFNPASLVLAGNSNDGDRLVLDVSRDDNVPLTTDTYTQTTPGEENGGQYYPNLDMSVTYNAGLKAGSAYPLVITISHLDDKTISGTFSGTFYKDGDTSSDAVVITNGIFNLQRQ